MFDFDVSLYKAISSFSAFLRSDGVLYVGITGSDELGDLPVSGHTGVIFMMDNKALYEALYKAISSLTVPLRFDGHFFAHSVSSVSRCTQRGITVHAYLVLYVLLGAQT